MSQPLISVIIPTHNNAQTIEVALISILRQTYQNLEIIVIDDNSTDTTKQVVLNMAAQDSRITYFKLEEDDPHRFDSYLRKNINAGYQARNFGFTKARGELITFQDGDDASLLNRIETQYNLLIEHGALHVTTDWSPFTTTLLNTSGDITVRGAIFTPAELYALSQKTKGIVAKLSPKLNSLIPFHYKRLRIIHKLFFASLAPYPGAGNSPLFHREIIDRVQFRQLQQRIWPSFMGRGADRDFNFQIAETFKNSYVFSIPLYLWKNKK